MQNGCLVVNAPTANTVAAAEHGIALICALSRNVAQADASMKAGKWERNKYVGVSIVGKTLAVMGFGKVCPGLHSIPTSGFACVARLVAACQRMVDEVLPVRAEGSPSCYPLQVLSFLG